MFVSLLYNSMLIFVLILDSIRVVYFKEVLLYTWKITRNSGFDGRENSNIISNPKICSGCFSLYTEVEL